MVFPGRFSTGCKRCKQRKVKCDEIRPSCRRCYIYGKPCPGYTDQFQFRIDLTKSNYKNNSDTKSSSSVTSSSSSSPPSQPPPPPPPPTATSTRRDEASEARRRRRSESDRAVILARSSSPAIAPHPDPSYDHVSLCYFVTRFVSPDRPDNFPGHLSFLPDIFNHYGNGPLELATLSVAQMAAYNQFGGDKFRLQSYQNHGRAVKALQKTIQSEDEVTDDRTIAAVLLLCIFKDIIGEGWGDPGEHASGLFYLLEKRGFEQIVTRRGAELFLLAFLRLQIHSFLRENDTYTNPGGLITFLGQFDPLLRAMSLMTTVLSLRHALSKDQVQAPPHDVKPDFDLPASSAESEECTIKACYETLKEFDDWDLEAQSYWQSAYDDRTVPAGLGQVAMTAKDYDPETACTLILVRCARLVLLLSMLEYYERMRVLDGAEFGNAGREVIGAEFVPVLEQTVRSTIDDMLACVPHAIGDLDSSGRSTSMAYDGAGALVILQPLRLITYCPYATCEQTQMGQNVLHRMNELMGIKSATSWEESLTLAPKWGETRRQRRAMALARVAQGIPLSPQGSVLSDGTAI